MPRLGVSKEDIFQAANEIAASGEMPTMHKIRDVLGGRGSGVTLHKYLMQWKKELLKHANQKDTKEHESANANTSKVQSNPVANEALETKYHVVSHALIDKEQENIKLEKECLTLRENLGEVTQQFKVLTAAHEVLSQSFETLKSDRDSFLEKMVLDKDKQIERLKSELQQTNEKYLDAIQQVGQKGDKNLIAEKVKSMNLVEKNKRLSQEVVDIQKKLESARAVVKPLKKQIAEQDEIIGRFVSWEELKAFNEGALDE